MGYNPHGTGKLSISLVYKAINVLNGDFYIGITCQHLCERKSKHKFSALKQNSPAHFHRAIRKYGWHNFKFEICSTWDAYDDAKKEEVRLIAELKPQYNMTRGGDGSEGYKQTAEAIDKMRARMLGTVGYWKGKTLPQHVVEILRERGRARSDKSIVLAKGPQSRRRGVVCLDDGLSFESVSAAAKNYGLDESQISAVCNRRTGRHSVGGLVFRFIGSDHGGKVEAVQSRAKARLQQSRPGLPRGTKEVVSLSDGSRYRSVKEASATCGVSANRIIKSCKRRYRNPTNLQFAYFQEGLL